MQFISTKEDQKLNAVALLKTIGHLSKAQIVTYLEKALEMTIPDVFIYQEVKGVGRGR